MKPIHTATAFAPATVGNVAVGFDLLGHALEGAGDRVTVTRIEEPVVRIVQIRGVATNLPRDPRENCATAGMVAMRARHALPFGIEVQIDKGLPIGSGMGGSAASAAAGVLAASALLDVALSEEEIFELALLGEQVATGAAHGDNLAPCLYGGLQFITPRAPFVRRAIPVPSGLLCVHVHPHMRLDTRISREALTAPFALEEVVAQQAQLVLFLDACWRQDASEAAAALQDVLVAPRRAALIPGFDEVVRSAHEAGASNCTISGAGPSMCAWCVDEQVARRIGAAMQGAFARAGLKSDLLISPVDARGARIEERAPRANED